MSDWSDTALVEAIAVRVVELLREGPDAGRLIDAAEVAGRLNVSRTTVYANADELGAVRLGSGPRARLRFDPRVVAARLATRQPGMTATQPATKRPRPARRRSLHHVDLLPIAGR